MCGRPQRPYTAISALESGDAGNDGSRERMSARETRPSATSGKRRIRQHAGLWPCICRGSDIEPVASSPGSQEQTRHRQHGFLSDLEQNVRKRSLMSIAGHSDCYSLGYSVCVHMPGAATALKCLGDELREHGWTANRLAAFT